MNTATAATIAKLNDALRIYGEGGRVMMTSGVAAMSRQDITAAISHLRAFNTFNRDNDPHGEHDCGSFKIRDETLFWKIDYYDKELEFGSENPADATVTTRVLTIMLAAEY